MEGTYQRMLAMSGFHFSAASILVTDAMPEGSELFARAEGQISTITGLIELLKEASEHI